MYVPCWNCGHDVWIETQTDCRHCGEPAKRCLDCMSFTATSGRCAALDVTINETEASSPNSLSQSYRCPQYNQSPDATRQAAERKTAGDAKQREPAASAPQPAARKPEAKPRKQARPHVIAHRGHATVAPENTITAIRAAADLGVNAIEIDVHLTKDGIPVVIHDATVDRTTDGEGAVEDLTFAEIRSLDAGTWSGPGFGGLKVPTLREALESAGKCLVNLHVRCHENESDRAEKVVYRALQDTGRTERCWISHHTRHGLYRFRELDKKLRLCWVPGDGGEDIEYIDDAYYMGYRIIQPTFRAVTPEFVEYAKAKKMWINVFWADEEDLMRELTDLGVNGILTNQPEVLQRVVSEKRDESSSADS